MKYSLALVFVCLAFVAQAQHHYTGTTGTLYVEIKHVPRHLPGPVHVYIFKDPEAYPMQMDKAVASATMTDVHHHTVTHKFEELPHGHYAIVAYMDLNENGQLDLNSANLPKEPIGASNMSDHGKPNWRDANFYFEAGNMTTEFTFLHN